jgi:membrane-bound serine protease (ClpP class)
MSQDLIWAFGLVLLAAALAMLEFLLPSGGLLGGGAVLVGLAAVVLGFQGGLSAGFAVSATLLVLIPAFLAVAVRIWPYTPIGRRMLNLPPDGAPSAAQGDERLEQMRRLVGRVGVAKTDLLPGGLVEIDGRRFDALAKGTAVDAGHFVEVCSVEAGKIRVRPTSRRPDQPPEAASDAAPEEASSVDELHNKTLEELDLEDLGDPLS